MSNLVNVGRVCNNNIASTDDILFYPTLKETPFTEFFDAPIAHYKFPPLNDDQKAQLASLGLEEDAGRKTFTGIIAAHHVETVLKLGARDAMQVPGTCSRSGFAAYIMCGRAMRLFSHVSTYGSVTETEYTRYDTCTAVEIGKHNTYHLVDATVKTALLGVPMTGVHSILAKAEPIFLPFKDISPIPSHNVSTSSPISNAGLVFPYFHGMLLPDREFTIPIFQRFFYRCLGSTPERANNTWTMVKTGLRNLSMTRAGKAISHAFLGMLLADNGQCGIKYIISNGTYKGFVLIGDDFNVIFNNRVYTPLPASEVMTDLKSVSVHDTTLASILAIIRSAVRTVRRDIAGKATDVQEVRYNYVIEDISTSRKFWTVIRKLDLDFYDGGSVKQLKDLSAQLKFGEQYAMVRRSTILVFLSYVILGDRDILKDFPTYISPSTLFADDRITNGLAIFGPSAPDLSFATTKEKVLTIVKEDKDDENLFKVDGNFNLRELPYKMMPIHEAASHWTNLSIHGNIYIPLPRPGKDEFSNPKQRSSAFTGADAISVYKKVKEMVNLNRDANSGKRKTGPQEGPTAKKSRYGGASTSYEMDF